MAQNPSEPNVRRVLDILRRRGIWIPICMLVAGVAAYGLSKAQTKKYTATTSVVFNNDQLSQTIAGLPATITNSLVQQANNLELLHLGNLDAKTAARVGHGITERDVAEAISITGQTESNIAGISATLPSPVLATTIANAYAQQFVKAQQDASRRYFQSALKLVKRQLASLTPQQRNGTAGINLQDRVNSLMLLSELQPHSVQIAQAASTPTQPSSPRTSKNTVIGLALGLLAGLGLVLLLERIDPRIKDPRELGTLYRTPVLGVVPENDSIAAKASAGGAIAALPPHEAEAFRIIRARLRSFNRGRSLRVVLISSAAQGDGKTTIARHLAVAAAGMGARVLLVEADLRCPSLARELGVASRLGVADVLRDSSPMEEVIKSVELAEGHGTSVAPRALDLLPAGTSPPPNPVPLIESPAMDELLSKAKSLYELVVIDAPELTAISDAFLILPRVDGVVIVGRVSSSRRDVAEGLRQLLDISHAPVVGVIANGVKRSAGRDSAYVGAVANMGVVDPVGNGAASHVSTADRDLDMSAFTGDAGSILDPSGRS